MTDEVSRLCGDAVALLGRLDLPAQIAALNTIRAALHDAGPFRGEPVDFVAWVLADGVRANSYNPNSVAPPEMELLRKSIRADGYTQPIVGMLAEDGMREVIDGFHRHRVGKECPDVRDRVMGYLPVVQIRSDRKDIGDRMAATIRHNRARGKHRVDAMSDIVIELKRRNWGDEKIARELGMDADEVLRLCQITGLAEVFKDQQFSQAWEADRDDGQAGEILSDVIEGYEAPSNGRILHTFDKWECYRAGFYAERPPGGLSQEAGEELYRQLLADGAAFSAALEAITAQWTHSCEHYLTNERMNRIAWLGQAAAAYAIHMPSGCRGGYHKLTDAQRAAADELALQHLNKWLASRGKEAVTFEQAGGRTEAELY